MDKRIQKLSNHCIICGAGETGHYVVEEFIKTKTPFVLIENDPVKIERLRERADRSAQRAPASDRHAQGACRPSRTRQSATHLPAEPRPHVPRDLSLPFEGDFQVGINRALNQDHSGLATDADTEFDCCVFAALCGCGELRDRLVRQFGHPRHRLVPSAGGCPVEAQGTGSPIPRGAA